VLPLATISPGEHFQKSGFTRPVVANQGGDVEKVRHAGSRASQLSGLNSPLGGVGAGVFEEIAVDSGLYHLTLLDNGNGISVDNG